MIWDFLGWDQDGKILALWSLASKLLVKKKVKKKWDASGNDGGESDDDSGIGKPTTYDFWLRFD